MVSTALDPPEILGKSFQGAGCPRPDMRLTEIIEYVFTITVTSFALLPAPYDEDWGNLS